MFCERIVVGITLDEILQVYSCGINLVDKNHLKQTYLKIKIDSTDPKKLISKGSVHTHMQGLCHVLFNYSK